MRLLFPPPTPPPPHNTTIPVPPKRVLLVLAKDLPIKDVVMNQVHSMLFSNVGEGDGQEEGSGGGTLWIKSEAHRHHPQQPAAAHEEGSLQWSYFEKDGLGVGESWGTSLQTQEEFEDALEKVSIKYVDTIESMRWVLVNLHLFRPAPRAVILDDFTDLCNMKQDISPVEVLALANEYLTTMTSRTSRPGCLVTVVTNSNPHMAMSTAKIRWAFDERIDITKADEKHFVASRVDHSGNADICGGGGGGGGNGVEKVLLKVVKGR